MSGFGRRTRLRPVNRSVVERCASILGSSSASAHALVDAEGHDGPVLFWQDGNVLIVEKISAEGQTDADD